MWQERRIPDEERFGLPLRLGDEVEHRLHALAANRQPGIAMASRGIGHAVGEADIGVCRVPELATLKREIARVRKRLGQDERVAQQTLRQRIARPLFPGRQRAGFGEVVARDAVLMRQLAREQTGQRRRTHGHRVAARVEQARRRHAVEVRCPYDLMSHEAVVAIPVIVRDDEDDVRACGNLGRRPRWQIGTGCTHGEQDEPGQQPQRAHDWPVVNIGRAGPSILARRRLRSCSDA